MEDSYQVEMARKNEELQKRFQDVEITKQLKACDTEMGADGKDSDGVFAQAVTADDNDLFES